MQRNAKGVVGPVMQHRQWRRTCVLFVLAGVVWLGADAAARADVTGASWAVSTVSTTA